MKDMFRSALKQKSTNFLKQRALRVREIVTKRWIFDVHCCYECVCVCTLSYHSRIPQVEGVPAEALWEAVGLLTNVVFVGFNGAM